MHKITPETCSDSINIHIGAIIVNSFIKLNSLLNRGFFRVFFLVMAFIFTLCKVDFTQPKFFLPEINNNANKTEYI